MSHSIANGISIETGSSVDIPPSSVSISVKVIDVSTIANVPTSAIFTPPVPGIETLSPVPSFVFLLEHPSGQKLLFDLGIRKDVENLDSEILERFKRIGHRPIVEKNVAEVLDEAGIGSENINAVIWSHAHWDHTGDMSTFGGATDLVVGPGFKTHFLGEGKGNSTLGKVAASDVEGRQVREIVFNESDIVQIGKFPSYDYFKDGSLYLLDTPGHCVGHLCALVRTTTNPDTFVFLGGDAAHHCAEYRPSSYRPLPKSMTSNPTTQYDRQIPFCPGAWFEELQISRNRDPKGPLWQPAFGHDMPQVLETIEKMQKLDGDDNVFVMLAHDATLRSPDVSFFPKAVNDLKAKGLGQQLRWEWIGDIMRALKARE